MPRTSFTVVTPKGPHESSIAADALDFSFNAGDTTNNNDFTFTGRELIVVYNSGVSARTFTLVSAEDTFKRTQDVTNYSVGAGEYAAFWAGDLVGWNQSGVFHIDPGHTDLQFAIFKIP